jgi:histidinol dehydrogenase
MIRIMAAEAYMLRRETSDPYGKARAVVAEIIDGVRTRGDAAVREYTQRFDGVALEDVRIPESRWEEAYQNVSPEFLGALRAAAVNIRDFHERQRRNSWFYTGPSGILLGQMIRPLRRVGVYVPGGRAAYPSSVLMNVIPAQVAGVSEIVLVTPPSRDGSFHPGVLVAARELGVAEVYGIGGAQAIAAMAYGTETVAAVDKIVGPGNVYVALAKQMVYGRVAIDMMAGPSEILVIADDSADPEYVAADLLSQAEHDPMAAAVLVTDSAGLARQVQDAVSRQLAALPRREIAEESLRRHGAILVVASREEAVALANRLAPEHLELLVERPHEWLGKIENAGAVFLGPYSPEPVGDYFAGPNHVLPTNGTARFSSPLSVDDFLKKSSIIQYSEQALREHGDHIVALAEAEGLTAHANAVRVRLARGRRDSHGKQA